MEKEIKLLLLKYYRGLYPHVSQAIIEIFVEIQMIGLLELQYLARAYYEKGQQNSKTPTVGEIQDIIQEGLRMGCNEETIAGDIVKAFGPKICKYFSFIICDEEECQTCGTYRLLPDWCSEEK